MNTRTYFLGTSFALLSATVLGLFSPPVTATAPVPMNTGEQTTLEDRLSSLAKFYGDESGFIELTTQDDGTLYVSTAEPQQSFEFYAMGDLVDEDSVVAGCSVGNAGEPEACDEAYGETMMFALESLALAEPDLDPHGIVLQCNNLSGEGMERCRIIWDSGRVSCWSCQDGDCTHFPNSSCD